MSQKRGRSGDDAEATTYLTASPPPPPSFRPDEEEDSLLDSGDLDLSEVSPLHEEEPAPRTPSSPPSDLTHAAADRSAFVDEEAYSVSSGEEEEEEGRGKGKKKKKKKKKVASAFWAHPIGLTLDPLQPRVLIVFEREVPLHIVPSFSQQRYFFVPLEAKSAGLWNVLCEYKFKRAHLCAWNLTAAFTRRFGSPRIPTPLKPLPVRNFHPYETALMEDVEVLGERVFATKIQRDHQTLIAKNDRVLSANMLQHAMKSSIAPLAKVFPQWTEPVPHAPLYKALGLDGQRLVTLDRLLGVLAILHGQRLVKRLAGLHETHVNSKRTTIYPKPAKPLSKQNLILYRALHCALPQGSQIDGFEHSRTSTLLNKWTRPAIQKALRAVKWQQKTGQEQVRRLRALDHDKKDLAFIVVSPEEAHRVLHSVDIPLAPPRHHTRFFLGALSARLGGAGLRGTDVFELTDEELVLLQTLLDQDATTTWLQCTPYARLRHTLRKAGGYHNVVAADSDSATHVQTLDVLVTKALVATRGRFSASTPRNAYHLSWSQLLYTVSSLVHNASADLSNEGLERRLWYGGPSLRTYALDFATRVLAAYDFLGSVPSEASLAVKLLSWTSAGSNANAYFTVNRLAPFATYREHLREASTGFHSEIALPALQIAINPYAVVQEATALRAVKQFHEEFLLGEAVMTAHDVDARVALRSMRTHIRDALFGQVWSMCVIHPDGTSAPFTRSAYERAFAPDALQNAPVDNADDSDDLGLEDSSDEEEEVVGGAMLGDRQLCFGLAQRNTVPLHRLHEIHVVNLEAFSSRELKQLFQWLVQRARASYIDGTRRVVLHYRSGAYFLAAGDPVGLVRQVLDRTGDLTSHLNSHASSALVQQRWTRILTTRFDACVARGRAHLLGVPLEQSIARPTATKELTVDCVQEPWAHGLRARRPHDEREAAVYWTTWTVLQQLSAAAWGMLYASELRLVVREVPKEITPETFAAALDTMYRESNAGNAVLHPNQHPRVCTRVFVLDTASVDAGDLDRAFKA